jgi:hypothetical protein
MDRDSVFDYSEKSPELYPEGHEQPEPGDTGAGAEASQEPADKLRYPSLEGESGHLVIREKKSGKARLQPGYSRPNGLQDFLQLHPDILEGSAVTLDCRGLPLSAQDIETIAERIVDGTAVPGDFTMRPQDTERLEALLQKMGFRRDDEGLLAEPGSEQEKWLEEEEPEP